MVTSQRPLGSMPSARTGSGVLTNTDRVNAPHRATPGRGGRSVNGNGCHTRSPPSAVTTNVRPSGDTAAAGDAKRPGTWYGSNRSASGPGGPGGSVSPGRT